MRLILWLAVVAACEKSGPVETTESTPSTPREPQAVTAAPPKIVGTLPNDAGVAVADAEIAKAAPDAKVDNLMIDQDARATAKLLGAGASDPKDAGDMRRPPSGDLDKQIQNVRDSGKVVIAGGTGRGGGDPKIGTGRGPSIDSPGTVGADPGSPPAGRISIAGKQAFDESSLTADAALAKVQSVYMAGIKRCYKTQLQADPNAKGKVSIRFTVDEAGRTINGKAIGFAKPMDDCITAQMASWRFPIPKDKDGEPTQASFDFKLNFVTD